MKARRVRKLDPSGTLADNAERVARVRLDELLSCAEHAIDPCVPERLHDMRIAAKRLRYVLELTHPCFGPYARTAAKHARRIQEALGEIHDCDVLVPIVLDHIARVRARDVEALRQRDPEAAGADPALTEHAPNRTAYRPLELLVVHEQARRDAGLESFVERWRRLERSGFEKRLRRALTQRTQVQASPIASQALMAA